jgi:uncharacterized protein YqjF (DUF2071 family)
MVREAVQGAGELLLRPAPLVSDSFKQREVLREADHRPWPLPRAPWLMGQTWTNLLFAHWPVSREALERVVPAPLLIDEYEGTPWLGVTPFRVENLRLRGTPPVPPLSEFPELNVRTYVTVDGAPGIYFLSLDAASSPAVHAARFGYRLPYFRSRMAMAEDGSSIAYDATRVSEDGPPAEFRARYGATGGKVAERRDSLERWLTERYCLYTLDEKHTVHRGEIHHPPWPLRRAWAEIDVNTMADPHGIDLEGEPLLHFSPRQDVVLWPIEPVTA